LELIEDIFEDYRETNDNESRSRSSLLTLRQKQTINNINTSNDDLNITKSFVKIKADERLKYQSTSALLRRPLTSTAEGVKHQLKAQIKSILKNNNISVKKTFDTRDSIYRNSYYGDDLSLTRPISRLQRLSMSAKGQKQNYIKDDTNQNTVLYDHSFRDLVLFEIKSLINPTDLKDPVAAQESRIPVINTKYRVNVLKKDFCMKWLRSRRLTLFLQSQFYSEYKMACVLAQSVSLNWQKTSSNPSKIDEQISFSKKPIEFTKVEIDDELKQMQLNPL
jgi:hypothetical protein